MDVAEIFQGKIENRPADAAPKIPMMTARRLSAGSRHAIQAALGVHARNPANALVFASRHGESERTTQIITALAADAAISPTNFTMSVHNAAVGQFAITAQETLPSVSISAGTDTFRQSLHEARAFLEAGFERVLHVDFETGFPDVYRPFCPESFPAYAVAFLWGKKRDGQGAALAAAFPKCRENDGAMPPSLAFLREYLCEKTAI